MTEQEKIAHLRALIEEGKAKLSEAAQFAGENDIPLKYIDEHYHPEDDDGDDEEYYDEYSGLYFGGQIFSLEKTYKGDQYYWHNSNC